MDEYDFGTGQEDALLSRLKRALASEYTLTGWLGCGAFGDVFEARQQSTGQVVAIKVLRATENENARLRFRLEMRACAALNHPHIVRVLDAGRDDGDSSEPLYTVFEFVPGETLADRLAREGMLPVQAAVDLMRQVLDALQTAHRRGIVHRDLKPANIMVTETAGGLHAKILDFGVSAWTQSTREAGNARLTQSGERVGTPAYCAPEQLRGEPTSALVDYYAWGLTLLQCLTGEHPFGKCSMHEVLQAQFSSQPVPINRVLATHPLGDILRWTLEKEPTRRAGDAEQLLLRLSRLDLRGLLDDAGFLLVNASLETGLPLEHTEIAPLARARGERRPFTALCCRMALEQRLSGPDEEAVDEWLDDLRETVAQIARRSGGSVTSSGGAEFLVYFGLAASGEASARRAARAALEIRDHCVRRNNLIRARAGWNIDVHLGLHQGMVTVQNGLDDPLSSLNSTSITASRLCQLALPGDIATSQASAGLLLEFGKCEREAEHPAIGSPWYRLPWEPSEGPRDALIASGLAPLTVGRDAELARLAEVWRDGTGFASRCVVLAGPAGIGKTHLSTQWHRQLSEKGCRILEARCLPETQGSALQPILQLLRTELRLDQHQPNDATQVVAAFLAEHEIDRPSHMALLCAWLRLPPVTWPDPPLSPKKKRDQLLQVVVQIVRRLASAPTALFIEDIHWADPTTLEWMHMLVDSEMEPRLLLSCTLRTGSSGPDVESATNGEQSDTALVAVLANPGTLTLALQPLNETSARQLLAAAGGPDVDVAPWVERGAGVPLFLLELARCSAGMRDFVVPPSIVELLRIRIDQLGRAKETAQLASVIGPEFEYELLSELSLRGSDLLGDLNHLQKAGIVALTGSGDYMFRHSLLRDAAYQSLPRNERRRLHGCVGASLIAHHPELELTKPWILALHHHHAGQTERALTYGESAAAQALVRFDNLETLGYVRELKGVQADIPSGWLRCVEDEGTRARFELRLLALEATALMLTRGWADQELSRTCSRASHLFPDVPPEDTLQMRYVLSQYYFSSGWTADPSTGDDERARPQIDALIRTARVCGASAFQSLGRMMLAAWHLFQGYISTSAEIARSVERFADVQDAWKYGYDAFLCARSIEFQARWFLGDPEVKELTAETVRLAEALGHPATLANVQLYSLPPLQLAGDHATALRRCDQVLALCERFGLQGFPAYVMLFKGWAARDPALARSAFEALTSAGQRLCEVYCSTVVAEAEIEAGDWMTARERIDAAESRVTATGERYVLPQVLWLKARCMPPQNADEADLLFARALDLATSQGAHGMRARILEQRTLLCRSRERG